MSAAPATEEVKQNAVSARSREIVFHDRNGHVTVEIPPAPLMPVPRSIEVLGRELGVFPRAAEQDGTWLLCDCQPEALQGFRVTSTGGARCDRCDRPDFFLYCGCGVLSRHDARTEEAACLLCGTPRSERHHRCRHLPGRPPISLTASAKGCCFCSWPESAKNGTQKDEGAIVELDVSDIEPDLDEVREEAGVSDVQRPQALLESTATQQQDRTQEVEAATLGGDASDTAPDPEEAREETRVSDVQRMQALPESTAPDLHSEPIVEVVPTESSSPRNGFALNLWRWAGWLGAVAIVGCCLALLYNVLSPPSDPMPAVLARELVVVERVQRWPGTVSSSSEAFQPLIDSVESPLDEETRREEGQRIRRALDAVSAALVAGDGVALAEALSSARVYKSRLKSSAVALLERGERTVKLFEAAVTALDQGFAPMLKSWGALVSEASDFAAATPLATKLDQEIEQRFGRDPDEQAWQRFKDDAGLVVEYRRDHPIIERLDEVFQAYEDHQALMVDARSYRNADSNRKAQPHLGLRLLKASTPPAALRSAHDQALTDLQGHLSLLDRDPPSIKIVPEERRRWRPKPITLRIAVKDDYKVSNVNFSVRRLAAGTRFEVLPADPESVRRQDQSWRLTVDPKDYGGQAFEVQVDACDPSGHHSGLRKRFNKNGKALSDPVSFVEPHLCVGSG